MSSQQTIFTPNNLCKRENGTIDFEIHGTLTIVCISKRIRDILNLLNIVKCFISKIKGKEMFEENKNMANDDANRLNLFDFFGFPDRQTRDEALQICDINKLKLLPIEDSHLRFFDIYFEQYSVWSNHINNFSSHLWLHFLLMYYQYFQNPLDIIDIGKFQSPEAAHKIFFDTFAEDVALYLISYFDKHLEMFNDLYDLKQLSKKKHSLSRKKIIKEMKSVDALKELANEYQSVEQSEPFRQIVAIRNNFVHNQSSSYYGMQVTKVGRGVYASGNSRGISTKSTYSSVCELLRSYEQLCEQVTFFIKAKIEDSQEERFK